MLLLYSITFRTLDRGRFLLTLLTHSKQFLHGVWEQCIACDESSYFVIILTFTKVSAVESYCTGFAVVVGSTCCFSWYPFIYPFLLFFFLYLRCIISTVTLLFSLHCSIVITIFYSVSFPHIFSVSFLTLRHRLHSNMVCSWSKFPRSLNTCRSLQDETSSG